MNLLEAKSLTKQFGSTTAVDNVSFSLHGGEIYGLIGPNGSGKTTITKLLTGLYAPTRGNVLIDGRDRFRYTQEVNVFVGYIPDNPFVYEYMTGSEYLDFVAALYSLERTQYQERLGELLAFFPIDDILREPMESYSRGNKQKVMIVASLLHRPRLLIIDEPVVGLDLESTHHLQRLLEGFRQGDGAVLITTHTLSFLEPIVDRVGMLADGRMIAEGSIAALRERAGMNAEASLDNVYTRLIDRDHGVAPV